MPEKTREYGSAKEDYQEIREKETIITKVSTVFVHGSKTYLLSIDLLLGDYYKDGDSSSYRNMQINEIPLELE